MTQNSFQKGRYGEQLAVIYLCQHGYKIIQQNFRCRYGEIDIIATYSPAIIVFFEVKNWQSYSFTDTEYVINDKKRNRIVNASEIFLRDHLTYLGFQRRYDLIFLTGGTDYIDHRLSVFD